MIPNHDNSIIIIDAIDKEWYISTLSTQVTHHLSGFLTNIYSLEHIVSFCVHYIDSFMSVIIP
jgi:hypothetical protein